MHQESMAMTVLASTGNACATARESCCWEGEPVHQAREALACKDYQEVTTP
jgi:hypothetical protein